MDEVYGAIILDLDLRLKFLKALLNVPVRLLDRFLPDREPTFPQSVIVDRMFTRMFQAYRLEQLQGVFKERGNFAGDGNFLRLLNVSRKLFLAIGEDDRYYREWLGLLILLAHEEYLQWLKNLSAGELKFWCRAQWFVGPDCLSDEIVSDLKDEFAPDALSYYLHILSSRRYSSRSK